jgi:hypothetical protein
MTVEIYDYELKEIIETLNTALNDFGGDSRKIELARAWLHSFSEEELQPDEEELAELRAAIQASEEEDARGFYYTTEQVEAHLVKVKNELKRKKKSAAS